MHVSYVSYLFLAFTTTFGGLAFTTSISSDSITLHIRTINRWCSMSLNPPDFTSSCISFQREYPNWIISSSQARLPSQLDEEEALVDNNVGFGTRSTKVSKKKKQFGLGLDSTSKKDRFYHISRNLSMHHATKKLHMNDFTDISSVI